MGSMAALDDVEVAPAASPADACDASALLDTVRSRRRGAELEAAILSAAADELVDNGYAAFTIEAVCARAHTGKASIYRRWPSKQLLVLEAFGAAMPCPTNLTAAELGDISTRDALISTGTEMAAILSGRVGDLAAALAGQAVRDYELGELMRANFIDQRCDWLVALLTRGVARGEVRAGADNRLVAGVGPAMIMHQLFMVGTSPDAAWVTDVVDQVFMPMIAPCPTSS